ncbi:MAG: hypothetical protein CBB92_10140 [Flammeovirgaceae bacterium TMED32]|nr:MAG: hypothetical protein CBB92_10140 [Flammeovirgaceae bacterium TMED32]
MRIASLSEIKKELKQKTNQELIELILKLTKYKVDNKELLAYLLFESADENHFISKIESEIDLQFARVNIKSNYVINKNIRKIQRYIVKQIRFSKQKETEIALRIQFCKNLIDIQSKYNINNTRHQMLMRQIELIRKALAFIHEDLQFDYELELTELLEQVAH